MLRIAASATLVACFLSGFFAVSAAADDEPIWTEQGLVFPEGTPIPARLTDVERKYLEQNPRGPARSTDPPSGPIYCVPEYDPMEGLLIAWEGGFDNILKRIAYNITVTASSKLYVVVDSASEQTSVTSTLSSYGVDMNRVQFVIRTTDTVWIRDYGPRYIYEGDCRAIIDHTYNRPRPNDNAFNSYFGGTVKNHAVYGVPLVHGGGNFHLNGLGEGNATDLIVAENPSLTEEEIIDLWRDYQNLDTTIWTALPSSVDSTQHIDMWMQILGDHLIIISDWPADSGSTQDQICDNAAADFAARGWTVYRTPARLVSWTHYTYTNMVICNNVALIPSYTNATVSPYNAEALATYQAALPGKTVVPVDCEGIIGYAGAMHCIVMHVPVPVGGANPTTYLKNYRGGEVLDPNTPITINWISDDDKGVSSVDILLSRDRGVTFPTEIVTGTADDGAYTWAVPDTYARNARIRVVVHDGEGNSGYDESDDDLLINGTNDCPPDINGDRSIDISDLGTLLAAYGLCEGQPGYDAGADLYPDGCINLSDLGELLPVYGTECP